MAFSLAGLGSGAISLFIMIFVGLVLTATVFGFVFMYRNKKKYSQFSCVIFEKDGFGHLKSYRDQAGIFVDSKTNNKRFFMRKNKVGLNPDKIPYIETNGKKEVYLFKRGLKNFSFISYNFDDDNPEIDVGEEDVNWALNAYDAAKKRFSNSLIMQLMPFFIIAFVSIIILIIFVYFFKDFDVLKEAAVALDRATDNMVKLQASAIIQ